MGCLVELFFDIFIEGFMELIEYCYMKLILLIFPEKRISDKTRHIIESVTGLIVLCLFIALMVGVVMVLHDDPVIKNIGRYTVYISLFLVLGPIVLSILVWFIRCFKRKKNTG